MELLRIVLVSCLVSAALTSVYVLIAVGGVSWH
jgi:hypothetical protein